MQSNNNPVSEKKYRLVSGNMKLFAVVTNKSEAEIENLPYYEEGEYEKLAAKNEPGALKKFMFKPEELEKYNLNKAELVYIEYSVAELGAAKDKCMAQVTALTMVCDEELEKMLNEHADMSGYSKRISCMVNRATLKVIVKIQACEDESGAKAIFAKLLGENPMSEKLGFFAKGSVPSVMITFNLSLRDGLISKLSENTSKLSFTRAYGNDY